MMESILLNIIYTMYIKLRIGISKWDTQKNLSPELCQ